MMTETARLLLVDDSAETTQLFARLVHESLGCSVETLSHVDEVDRFLHSNPPFDAAVVDLSFAHQDGNGLDVLLAVASIHPSTKLIVLTTGDGWALELLRVAWEAFDLASAISKTASVEHQIRLIADVLANGSAPADGVLRAFLPEQRSPMRSVNSYKRLILHRGHKKLWLALLRCSPSADYAEIAALSGLSLNTIKNYRADMLPELELHGLKAPTMQQVRSFALLVRPLLWPHIADAEQVMQSDE